MTTEERVFQGERIRLRPLAEEDIGPLARMLRHPDLADWWLGFDEEKLRRETLGDPAVHPFAIEHEGSLVGIVEYQEEEDPDYRSASLDIALAAPLLGKGLGTDALRTIALYLFKIRGHHRLTIDPSVKNERAIRAYEKIGFKPVGILRRYERRPEGWSDSLLMDLLVDELR